MYLIPNLNFIKWRVGDPLPPNITCLIENMPKYDRGLGVAP